MFLFILGMIIILAGLVISFVLPDETPVAARWLLRMIAPVIGAVLIIISTAIYVEDDQAGVVVIKFGQDLPTGQIIATNGEKGPQAAVLPPGWHFGYWPWQYQLTTVDNITIPQGAVGVVEAKDGSAPLPRGEIFASEWDSSSDMLDGNKFMAKGHKGPQLTVLTPGQYRYNPRLFTISAYEALEVPIGKVAVIKANAGKAIENGETVQRVNGVPIVPKGYRGIWNEALTPNAYYLHPHAYIVTMVQTTNRVYEYTGKQSIGVKTIDGFLFPVDVRVSAKVSAEDAPLVVAMLANPDADTNKDGFNVLEDIVILPLIRAIFRNNAEDKKALEYVQNRSQIEKDASRKFSDGLKAFKITSDGVFIGENGLTDTAEGRKLMSTQTDKEVALQEKSTFQEQRLAEIERAKMVKAQEDANQEKNKAIAAAQVDIAKQEAQAEIERAEGKAIAYQKKIEKLGGVDNFVKLEMLKLSMDKWEGRLPNILLIGGEDGGNGSTEAVNALMMKFLNSNKQFVTPAK